jgi:triphosphatase
MQEIELKLCMLEDNPQALYDHPVINHFTVDSPITFDLKTIYYDTDDYALLKTGLALRVRENENGEFIQTVKTKGTQEQGLHKRDEYHVTLKTNVIDLELVEEAELRKQLQNIARSQAIKPLFCTQFSRTRWMLDLPGPCEVELALDLGEIRAENSAIPLHEIELELIKGQDVASLFELAANIASSMPVAVEDRSKAWKGYQLCQAIKSGKSYHDTRQLERQFPEFFYEQAAILRLGKS